MVFDLPKEQSSIIKVIGVGGGGSNAVNYMFSQGIRGVNFVICNTDAQALESSPVPNKIQLGPFLTEGLGAGADPEIGKRAAEESIEDIKKILEKNTKMVFITAGMGGGTGTGGAPVIAKIAREMGILTVGIVTRPFKFEGNKRVKNAEEGIEAIRKHVDSLIIISNDRVLEIYKNLKRSEAFGKANDILTTAAKSTSEIITYPGEINVDFADVQSVMRSGGVALMGHAVASGENRAKKAVEEALSSPLLNDNNIYGAQKVLINIMAGKGDFELTMSEIEDITTYVQTAAGETADVFFGTSDDETLSDSISVTVIATGFEAGSAQQNTTRKDKVETTQPLAAAPVVTEVETPVMKTVEEIVQQTHTVVENETLAEETQPEVSEEVTITETVQEAEETFIAETAEAHVTEETVAVNEVIAETKAPEVVTENNSVQDTPVDDEKIVYVLETETQQTEIFKENIESVPNNEVVTPNRFQNEVAETEKQSDVTSEPVTTANTFEFNLEPNSNTVEENETVSEEVQSDLFGSMKSYMKEETADEKANNTNVAMKQVQQTSYERMREFERLNNRLNNLNHLSELERVPAYKRKMIQLDSNTQPSATNHSSAYRYCKNEDGTFEIRPNNPHINDIVD